MRLGGENLPILLFFRNVKTITVQKVLVFTVSSGFYGKSNRYKF